MRPGTGGRNDVNFMQKKKHVLAFDIGTGSGRGILGTADMNGRLLDMRKGKTIHCQSSLGMPSTMFSKAVVTI